MENEGYMKRCCDLAVRAGKKGSDTFGAIPVHQGEILEEAQSAKEAGHADAAD